MLKNSLATIAAGALITLGLSQTAAGAAPKPTPGPAHHVVPGDRATGAKLLSDGSNYWYAGAWNVSSPTANTYYSASGALTVENPWTDTPAGDHSLAEIAIWTGSGTTRQIVEIGWCVGCTNGSTGDTATRLFVYAWRNGVESGYNPDAFVPYCAVPETCASPGDILTGDATTWTGTSLAGTRNFEIHYMGNAWWFAYDSKWIGYIPDSWWRSVGATFTAGSIVDYFGEVASPTNNPTCTDMGNANFAGTDPASAYVTTMLINGANPANLTGHVTDESKYSNQVVPPRSLRYGGPSSC